ncbi:MAG: hypothetical protein A2015_16985 [Spirochaetes bacterium GWF1_31_7]|nr:MAG: hypothetical protein A2Y30_14350 [Spirochaetes bacterium GWE1_32_154]OHD50412.1 MAG: hypothetical protein A2Y29_12395 [Spirochaetes bacterium GWE2_31_10]OHD52501.1 MAG: hypothetical protein A2015_16985 [Spirochaetes bacterium GWF1_31_7]OHD81961.1 MAG: hypothetical protein A2355_17610 [Spirochaetes bacterium RIFOXYB1_FULL_32_8]
MNGNKEITANFGLYSPTIPSSTNVKVSSWDNSIVYFVVTDRFYDGNTTNNEPYGRISDKTKAGNFYGGDLKGLTTKINEGYFTGLNIDAIWITSPVEQIHGWITGGDGAFEHYAYHGYYAQDFTKLDANMGTEDELKTFVDTAHSKGIKIVFDVVMNHSGYASIKDLEEFGLSSILKTGYENATVSNYHSFIDYEHKDWINWWGPDWIRAGLGVAGDYETGTGDLLGALVSLPDFKTESTKTGIGLPKFYAHKSDTNAKESDGTTVREYLVKWHTDWVKTYGIDGFRVDTAKHVELDSWKALKVAAKKSYADWKTANPGKTVDNEDFWMTGEVWGHGVTKSEYFENGFDSIINFSYQTSVASATTEPIKIEAIYKTYAENINTQAGFNVLSYISSHDTQLFFPTSIAKDYAKQKIVGTLLMLTPGAVQIYYGDEYGRDNSTAAYGKDKDQLTRSQMLFSTDGSWTNENTQVLNHWKKMTQFRKKHKAIGMGNHVQLSLTAPYRFARFKDADKVVCVIGASNSTVVDVKGIWANGTELTDFYTGTKATVTDNKVTFTAHANGVVLIEE